MIDRREIIAAARECLGTPFHHQGRLVGVGIDCIGTVVHPARRLGIPHTDCTTYRRRPDGVTLVAHLERNLVRLERDAAPGDVVCMWWARPDLPYHVGLVTERGLLHAHATAKKVVEHAFDEEWRDRVHSVWSYPGVDAWPR